LYDIEEIVVGGDSMEVFLFAPTGQGPHPGLILAQHIPVGHTGIENDTFTINTAERFCLNGYLVAVPFIFHWWPKDEDIIVKRDESRDENMVADIAATYDLLCQKKEVDDARIGLVGHCWGGRVAWLGACHLPHLAACAVFYGGRIRLPMGEGNLAPIELADQIRCPVAGYFGMDDQNPTPADVDDYARALENAGVHHEFHRYEGAGHAFQNFPAPERYREEQSEDAWLKVLDFVDKNVKRRIPRTMLDLQHQNGRTLPD
jgi:carboxymethylenebutenolidase